jgi:chromate transporter
VRAAVSQQPETYSLARLSGYFLRLGTAGFGGPIALVGYMQRDLVEERHWYTDAEYVEGLALAQLAPGPLAAQLAIYLGYTRAGVFGATAIGLAFIAPSFLMVLLIAAGYRRFGGLPWMQAVFYGVGAAVIGIIARSAWKLIKLTLASNRLLWFIFVLLAVTTALLEREPVWLFLLSGVAFSLITVRRVPKVPSLFGSRSFVLAALALSTDSQFVKLLAFFAKAGLFVFGSGLAIVPFLHGGVVQQHHWLTERQFLDAVAVAMITPGPVVITVAFIGFLVAGTPGAFAAAIGVFLPVYLTVVIVAPYFKRVSANGYVRAFVKGVTAAATGAIAGAVLVLARHSIRDLPTALLAVAAFVVLFKWRVPEPIIVSVSGILGVLLYRL